MLLLVDLLQALRGLSRLFRFDAGYRDYFDKTIQGTWRSFFAMMLVAPVVALTLPDDISKIYPNATSFEYLAVVVLIYIISWTLYPQIAHEICRRLGKQEAFPAYLTIYNWFQLIHIPFGILLYGILQVPSNEVLVLFRIVEYVCYFSYLFFLSRKSLQLGALPASAFVVADFLMSEGLVFVSLLILAH